MDGYVRIKTHTRIGGFSLVEILVTLLVLTVLITLAAPAFTNILMTNRLATESNTFLSALHLARSEAVKRNVRVVLCISANGAACANSGGWHQGWIMFTDVNNNALFDVNETLLRQSQALPVNVMLTGNSLVARYISYTPSGATRLISGFWQVGTLKLCHASLSSSDARWVIINSTGRPRIEKTIMSSCP